ncbi:MAG: ATP-binding protein [Oscillospiraceae bacterium]
MHNSIFTRFFYLCFSILAGALICVGAVHIFVSLETYQRDMKNDLTNDVIEAVEFAQVAVISDTASSETAAVITNYFNTLSAHTDTDLFLTDDAGRVLYCSDSIQSIMDRTVSEIIMSGIREEGTYSFSTMNGFYEETWFNMGYKVTCGGRVFYVFGRKSADSMRAYMVRLLSSYLLTAVIVMSLFYPVLYYSIMHIVRPISDMTKAAQRFGEGDFSQKIKTVDDSELGYLANAMNEMAASLEQIEETRKSFISNVSHELKTPMTTIGGFVDGILDGTIPKAQHRYYLRIVSEEVDRLARLVRSMLNISKYESGEVELQTESFEANALIFKTVLLFEKRIDDKHVQIEGLDSDRFYLNADIDLTQQVIYNLTENAVKFVNDGGTITFGYEVRGDLTAIRIRNSGEGLKQNEISKVFDRFYKTDESRGKDKTGVGLGLSIVRSIIKLHNGEILVRSKSGEYTEFEFTLPTGTPPPKKAAGANTTGSES